MSENRRDWIQFDQSIYILCSTMYECTQLGNPFARRTLTILMDRDIEELP